ncbi:BatA domain-containing protein [Pseudoxanthomonas suwonensis]|uniref:Membrane protein n=1 Tax=Pseudoxanthomonas suwonensis TaxID=314722 RepID=A0A0E3Z1J4_9GAMM|nr:BatA domain-containing protein [Pseudoxanthomonas suwonensis]AKC86643.1 membrane protein [Pseudoxanthomonas suwonensis]
MSLALLLPAALVALAALLVPLLLHLARRSQLQPTPFAALRWLRQKPRPRHRIRFDEWPLLLLRLLLLAGLALWLAQPVLLGREDRRPYVAVATGVDAAAIDRDTLPAGARLHRLAAGFPALDATGTPAGPAPLASLLRQLDAELPAGVPLTVIVPDILDGTDAQRPRLSRAVDWRIVDGGGAAPREPAATVLPSIRHGDGAEGLRYLRAAARAWQPPADDGGEVDVSDAALSIATAAQPPEAAPRPLLWLGAGELPAAVRQWIQAGGTALVDHDTAVDGVAGFAPLWRDAQGTVLVEGVRDGRGRLLRFTVPLRPQAMPVLLEADFPQRLLALLQPPAPAPALVAATAYTPDTGDAVYPQPPLPLQPWLAVLLAALFALERWLATRRQRGPSP